MRPSRLAPLLLLLAACGGAEPDGRQPEPAPAAEALVAEPRPAPAAEAAAAPAPRSIVSEYTTLTPEQCRTTETDEETGDSTQRCPGVEGHALEVFDGDARVTVSVITPDRRKHPLRYSAVITHNFSSLGPRAEWRIETGPRGRRVVGLIVRVNASEDPENPGRSTSYLAVARIAPGPVCVTDRIPPSADANVRAREAADGAAGRPCRTEAALAGG